MREEIGQISAFAVNFLFRESAQSTNAVYSLRIGSCGAPV